MNPVFWLLVAAALGMMWLMLSFLFKPIGRFFTRLVSDAIEEMKEEKETTEE